ncbi:MAG: hypothetical protein M1839_006410 [Geoglossum umbratile]|nr:MAG: hypothetical protein M1839_006410 [Geoglossum umbratile]
MAGELGQAANQQQWARNVKLKNTKSPIELVGIPPPSLLYSILPSSVKSRLPQLPSLRRSVSASSQKGRSAFLSLNCRRTQANQSGSACTGFGTRTPPPAYSSALAISTALKSGTSDADDLEYLGNQLVAAGAQPFSTDPECGPICLFGTGTNIDWKFAAQGRDLLSSAVEESLPVSQGASSADPAFIRQLYIHSLTYLLRGLPHDLSTEERLSLRTALPSGVALPVRLEDDDSRQSPYRDSEGKIRNWGPYQPSLLHRILASLVVQLFIFAHFLLPHIKVLLRKAYIYERNNRISEKVLAKGIDTVDTVGKKGIEFGEAVAKIGDGKLGQAFNELAVWCFEGVAGGIYEGVGEGMVILSAKCRADK